MTLFGSALAPSRMRAASSESANLWGIPDGFMQSAMEQSSAGVVITDNTIKQCAVALAALRFLANAVAVCAPRVIHELPGGMREPADPNYFLARLMRRPNPKQSRYRWVHSQIFRAALFGNSNCEIIPGPLKVSPFQTFAAQLYPLDPHTTYVCGERSDGELVYRTTRQTWDANGQRQGSRTEILPQERMFHLRGVTGDGDTGEPIYYLIRNAIGIAMAAERLVSTSLRKGNRLSGLLITPGPMDKVKRDELRDAMNANLGGTDNAGTFGVLPFGVDIKPVSQTNVQAQMQELRDWQIGDILRHLGVPGIVVGYGEKTSTYASAKEFFESGGLKHCVLPWIENFEDELEFSLLTDGEPYQVKFNMDVLSRPTTWNRIEMLVKAAGRPYLTGNEARSLQDLNPIEDDETMDTVVLQLNTGTASQPGAPLPGNQDPNAPPAAPAAPSKPAPVPPTEDPEDPIGAAQAPAVMARQAARAQALAHGVARALVADEIADLSAKAVKLANNPNGWKMWVATYYDKRAPVIAETLAIPLALAKAHCDRQSASVMAHGISVVEGWADTVPPTLEALALEATPVPA